MDMLFMSPLQQLLQQPTTTSSFATSSSDSNEDQQQLWLNDMEQQLDNMINEFWNNTTIDDDDDSTSWKTIPFRIQQLVHSIEQIYEKILFVQQQQQQQQQTVRYVTFHELVTIITASILVQQPSTNIFIRSFENYFVAALMYHIIVLKQQQQQGTGMVGEGEVEEEDVDGLSFIENENDIEILHHLFGNDSGTTMDENIHVTQQQQQQQTQSSSLSSELCLFHNLRRLGWIHGSNIVTGTVATTTATMKEKTTTTAAASQVKSTVYLLQDTLVLAIRKVMTKKIRTMIEGNYDQYDTNNQHATTATTSAYQYVIHWVDEMILSWLIDTVFDIHTTMNSSSIVGVEHNTRSSDVSMKEHTIDDTTTTIVSKVQLVLKDTLQTMIVQVFWSIRVKEMFNIVTSYPESIPAIQELKFIYHQLLQKSTFMSSTTSSSSSSSLSDMRIVQKNEQLINELAESLRHSFMVRLNHPGATTTQMIDIYIAAMQVLRMLLQPPPQLHDDTNYDVVDYGMLSANHINTTIAYTTEPVRSYLRNHRNDTVRCILTSLTNTTGNSNCSTNNNGVVDGTTSTNHVLYQELRRQDTKPLEYLTMNSDDEEDDEEECPTMDWQPRPSIYSYTHQQNQRSSHYHRSDSNNNNKKNDSDILAMLVSIYGSKELFVNEYRSMLADKLLGSQYEYNTDQDVHTLELLKLRFGEMSLLNAEIMIKDIEDSARINKNIRDSYMTKKSIPTNKKKVPSKQQQDVGVVIDAAIVSYIFWPKLYNTTFQHHPRIQSMLDEYATIYAEQKNPRTLQWYTPLGSVTLELDVLEEQIDDRTGKITSRYETKKEFTCTPLHATLISYFEDKPTWTVEQLSNETHVPEHIIVKQMSYWITQRVVVLHRVTTTSKHTTSNNFTTYTLASKSDQSNISGSAFNA